MLAWLPVGLELLGRPLQDARLLALGFSFEQSFQPRRAPVRTPPLENGRAPEPVAFEVTAQAGRAAARVLFAWDVTTSTLLYEAAFSGIPTTEILGAGLHQAQEEREGGVLYRLSGPGGRAASGEIALNTAERAALMEGDFYLRLYTTESPYGGPQVQLSVP